MRPSLKKLSALCVELERRAKPCPFCGCTKVYVGPADSESFHVECRNRKCRASGPPANHPEIYDVPKRFVVNGEVPEKNFWPSQEHLEMSLVRQAFRQWQARKSGPVKSR